MLREDAEEGAADHRNMARDLGSNSRRHLDMAAHGWESYELVGVPGGVDKLQDYTRSAAGIVQAEEEDNVERLHHV